MPLIDPEDNKIVIGLIVATVGAVLALGFLIWLARVSG